MWSKVDKLAIKVASQLRFCLNMRVSNLGAIIMKDPSPSQNLMKIFDWIRNLKISNTIDNLEVQLNLLDLYKHTLLKFSTSMTKADIELKNIIQDPFFTMLKDFLNDSNLANIIEEVLEVVQNDNVNFDDEFVNNTTLRIEIINKMYKNYRKEMTTNDKIMLKSVICLALECLNIILSMIYTQVLNEKKINRN